MTRIADSDTSRLGRRCEPIVIRHCIAGRYDLCQGERVLGYVSESGPDWAPYWWAEPVRRSFTRLAEALLAIERDAIRRGEVRQ